MHPQKKRKTHIFQCLQPGEVRKKLVIEFEDYLFIVETYTHFGETVDYNRLFNLVISSYHLSACRIVALMIFQLSCYTFPPESIERINLSILEMLEFGLNLSKAEIENLVNFITFLENHLTEIQTSMLISPLLSIMNQIKGN